VGQTLTLASLRSASGGEAIPSNISKSLGVPRLLLSRMYYKDLSLFEKSIRFKYSKVEFNKPNLQGFSRHDFLIMPEDIFSTGREIDSLKLSMFQGFLCSNFRNNFKVEELPVTIVSKLPTIFKTCLTYSPSFLISGIT
jgi:hypothetical protein